MGLKKYITLILKYSCRLVSQWLTIFVFYYHTSVSINQTCQITGTLRCLFISPSLYTLVSNSSHLIPSLSVYDIHHAQGLKMWQFMTKTKSDKCQNNITATLKHFYLFFSLNVKLDYYTTENNRTTRCTKLKVWLTQITWYTFHTLYLT